MTRFTVRAILFMWCVGTIAGCAATVQEKSFQDKQVVKATGDRGVVYLALGSQWYEPLKKKPLRPKGSSELPAIRFKKKKALPLIITIINLKNDSGETIGEYVIPEYSGDFMIDALKKELSANGYSVSFVKRLPKNVGKGIDLSKISTNVTQNSMHQPIEGRCDLQVKMDIWRNGAKVNTHDYVSNASGNTYSNQHQLAVDLMIKATQDIMKQAVPDIIKDI